jgi:hypothetical protein
MLISFKDLISQDIIDLYAGQGVSVLTVIYSIIIVFILSLVILLVYKLSYQTTVYNRSFALSLPITAMVTSIIILTISSNLALSLGMVGALSIIRFRTALKNPFDTVFMFWSVGIGILVGAEVYLVAIVSTLLISAAIWLLITLEIFTNSYFLIIRTSSLDNEGQILDEVKDIYGKYTVKNKTVRNGKVDLTLEVRSKQDKSELVNKIATMDHVNSVVLLSHTGDYISE